MKTKHLKCQECGKQGEFSYNRFKCQCGGVLDELSNSFDGDFRMDFCTKCRMLRPKVSGETSQKTCLCCTFGDYSVVANDVYQDCPLSSWDAATNRPPIIGAGVEIYSRPPEVTNYREVHQVVAYDMEAGRIKSNHLDQTDAAHTKRNCPSSPKNGSNDICRLELEDVIVGAKVPAELNRYL